MKRLAWAIVLVGSMVPTMAMAASTTVVLSEFRSRGPSGGNDEFIELYNVGTTSVDIGGWKLMGSNSTGTTGVRATVPAGTTLPARSFFLMVNTGSAGYSGTVAGDLNYTTGVADNGGLALTMADGTIVDQAGMLAGSAYKEGTVLAQTTVNKDQSYERKTATCGPDLDTDNNATDFAYNDGVSHARNSHSCRPACAGDRCINVPKNVCKDANTSTQYPATGTCGTDGMCTYTSTDVACGAAGCNATPGLCNDDLCTGVTCTSTNVCLVSPGTCAGGNCSYAPQPVTTTCDDGKTCTTGDHCDGTAAATCVGTQVACTTPPNPTCKDAGTSTSFAATGSCVEGAGCAYAETDTTCPLGCNAATGVCTGDPCAGIVCNTPPNDQCYLPAGTCSAGVCGSPKVAAGTGCTDGSACTTGDVCAADGSCAGTAMVCSTPPNTQCWKAAGTCVAGTCSYDALATDAPCDDGSLCTSDDKCDATHACVGTAKVCTPAAPVCKDATTSTATLTSGCTVADGQCQFTTHDVGCPSGCDAATGRCVLSVVVSSFRTRGLKGGNDEFVEWFNAGTTAIDIGGWKLSGSNSAGTVSLKATVAVGTKMPPRTYFLFANTGSNGYSGTVTPDLTYTVGFADDGGVGIVDALGRTVDQAGMSVGSAFREGTKLPTTTNNVDQAWVRKTVTCGPDQDTDDNATDFAAATAPTVQHDAKSCRPACGGDPCVANPANACADASTLNTFPAGACASDTCSYSAVPVACPFGCDAVTGACKADLCAGMTCTTPSDAQCEEAAGTCAAGVCSYAPKAGTVGCDDGDACTLGDHCDGAGKCGAGTPVTCTPPATACTTSFESTSYSGGTCVAGECQFTTTPTACAFGCVAATGLCAVDPCLGVTCNAAPDNCHLAPGTCLKGLCAYVQADVGAPCDDGLLCTVSDRCDGLALCIGTLKACDLPPAATCVDGTTSRQYDPAGACRPQDGKCSYTATDKVCGSGCDMTTGLCSGDPCIGVKCNNPPDACHAATGTCTGGTCSYGLKGAGIACDDGDPCTTGDSCDDQGACVPGTAVADCSPDQAPDTAEAVVEAVDGAEAAAEETPDTVEAEEPTHDVVEATPDVIGEVPAEVAEVAEVEPVDVAAEAGKDADNGGTIELGPVTDHVADAVKTDLGADAGGDSGGGGCAAGTGNGGGAWAAGLLLLGVWFATRRRARVDA